MAKVVLNQAKAFDKDNGTVFTFSYQGTEDIKKNILRIYEFSDLQQTNPIITHEENSFKVNNLSPQIAQSLKNGHKYYANITVCTENGELNTTRSDEIIFYCFKTPTLTFKDLPDNIDTSSFNVILEFSYEDDKNNPYFDKLSEYKVLVYSSPNDKMQLSLYQTKRMFASGFDLKNLPAFINDLEAGKTYYLKAIGITVHEVNVESELYPITVNDTKKYIRNAFTAKVDNDNACVDLSSHLVNVDGQAVGNNISFKEGKLIIGNQSYVIFNKDVSVKNTSEATRTSKNNSFVWSMKISDFPIDRDLIKLNSSNNKYVKLSSVSNNYKDFKNNVYTTGLGCIQLTAVDDLGTNTISSEYIDLNYLNNNGICKVELLIIIERINGGYNLYVKNIVKEE